MNTLNTQDLVNVSPGEKIKLTLSGKLFNSSSFEGSDTVRVIRNSKRSELLSVADKLFEILVSSLKAPWNIISNHGR